MNGFGVSFYFFGLGSFMLIEESVHVARSLGLRVKKKKKGERVKEVEKRGRGDSEEKREGG